MSFLGRQTGERAMQGVGMHQQQHVGARVSAGEAGAGAEIALDCACRRLAGTHRCAHAWNGRGGETETAGVATRRSDYA